MKIFRYNLIIFFGLLLALLSVPMLFAITITPGTDRKVTNDNLNVDGGANSDTPSRDSRNRQENETTIAISPIASPITGKVGDIIAAASNDYRMVPSFGDSWMPVYVSFDGGVTWFLAGTSSPAGNGSFNTFIPGFPTDTSTEGITSPIKDLDSSGDPVIRFDAAGNIYAAALAFNRDFDKADRPVDTVAYVSKYTYSPGTAGSSSTHTTAGTPPNFTFTGTTIVDRGAVGFALPSGSRFGFAGTLNDKEWMEIDRTSSACSGNVYVTFTAFHGLAGSFPIKFSRSKNGGASFSNPSTITTGGKTGTVRTQGSDIAVAPNGTIYVVYRTFTQNKNDIGGIQIVKSTNCGKKWSNPVFVSPSIVGGQAPGVAFRTPTFAFVATDDTNSNIVYVAYQDLSSGNFDIFVQRSTDGGATWGPRVKVNSDGGTRSQIFPTIQVANGALHVAWYDFRNSVTSSNEALDVFYACSNCPGGPTYPSFSANVRVTDVSHNGNCLMFGGGTVAFHGDYIELDAHGNTVHVAWADNRDVSPCVLTATPAPTPTNSTGNRNQNIYADTITIAP
jgi:hypothetical protein